MHNGHDYLSCIKVPTIHKQTTQQMEKAVDLTADHRDLILAANRVFGYGKWNHAVVSQTLDYIETIGAKCCVGCASFVKVQLENGNFHEDVGYYSAEELTKGLSIYNARIGSAVNALKRVLLSFGDKIEKELQQVGKYTVPEQASDIQKNEAQSSNMQIQEKLSVTCKSVTHAQHEKQKSPESNKNAVPNMNNMKTDTDSVQLSKKAQRSKIIVQASPNQKAILTTMIQNNELNTKNEQNPKAALSASEIQRIERKRRQMEKQMEFKRRMMEKGELIFVGNDKSNPKY